MWWLYLIAFLIGVAFGYFLLGLATISKKTAYEEKLWELEKRLWRAEHEGK